MTKKLFSEHGDISSYWVNDLLILYVEGPFNVEGVTRYNQDIVNIVEQANLSLWARIELFINNDVMGPKEALKIIEKNIHHSKSNGCVALSVIGSNILVGEAMAEMCCRCNLDFHVFNSLIGAVNYSRKLIDDISSVNLAALNVQ